MPPTPLASLRAAAVALVAVVVLVAAGAIFDVKVAVLMLAAFALAGAVARLTMRAEQSFSVRRRYVDVSLLVAFAVVLAFLGLSTPLG